MSYESRQRALELASETLRNHGTAYDGIEFVNRAESFHAFLMKDEVPAAVVVSGNIAPAAAPPPARTKTEFSVYYRRRGVDDEARAYFGFDSWEEADAWGQDVLLAHAGSAYRDIYAYRIVRSVVAA